MALTRKNVRLKNFDYRSNVAYFVTICVQDRSPAFGTIIDGALRPTRRGRIATECWQAIPDHCPQVELDAFVLMPNHIHGILCFVGATHASPSSTTLASRSLGAVIGSYKSAVSRKINRLRPGAAIELWQRNYYEHVIRTDHAFNAIRQYIESNPWQWETDAENPVSVGPVDMAEWLKGLRSDPGDACVAPTAEIMATDEGLS